MKDILSSEGIKQHLKTPQAWEISVFNSVSSTNLLAKEAALQGKSEGRVIIAESQTDGRGRLGRKFESPKDSGLYMSILLRPDLSPENAVLITAAAAVAVSDAVESLSGKPTKIKWVNDVIANGKKICGILTEGGINPENGKFSWAVLGIGVNVYEPQNGFRPEIKDIAGAAFSKEKSGLKNRLAAEILNIFEQLYNNLSSRSFFEGYRKRMLTIGKQVSVIRNDNKRKALCLDLDYDCRLLVEYDDGTSEYISSGEVSVRPDSI